MVMRRRRGYPHRPVSELHGVLSTHKSGPVHEGERLALLGVESNARAPSLLGGESGGRTSDGGKGKSGELHGGGLRGGENGGLSNIDDLGIDLYWLREAEVKHSRVAMLAVAGILQVEIFGPAPGCEMATAKCQMDSFWQLWNAHPQYIAFGLIMIMMTEAFSGIAATTGRETGERAPGDFGLDPLGFKSGDPAAFARLEAQEIANGRLAMWAASGLLMQGCTTHQGGIENLMQSLSDNAF